MEGPSADLASKVRFLSHFGSRGRPKNDPWTDIFDQMPLKKIDGGVAGSLPEPAWALHVPFLEPKRSQDPFFMDFIMILDRFWTDFGTPWDRLGGASGGRALLFPLLLWFFVKTI